MSIYLLLLDADRFHGQIVPALTDSWKLRSFSPCQALCDSLLPGVSEVTARYHLGGDAPLLTKVASGLPFDRDYWTHLAGELFFFGAAEIPEIELAPETLCCLLAHECYVRTDTSREQFAPIQQAHYGSLDLRFGRRIYRPDYAGYNDRSDIARLAEYLANIDPARWSVGELRDLREVAEDERLEELELAQEWFPSLQGLYERARQRGQIVISEIIMAVREY